MDAYLIRRELELRILDLCYELLPGGQKRGQEYRCGSIDGGKGNSFGVRLTGSKAGTWAEFNGKAGGACGDLYDLIMQARRVSFREAVEWARDFTGMHAPAGQLVSAGKPVAYSRPSRPAYARRPAPGLPAYDYLVGERKLEPDVLAKFQVADGVMPDWHEHAGEPAVLFPYKRDGVLLMLKWLMIARPEGKKVVTTTKDAEPCLFGWQAVPDAARYVVLCEGEIDAMTWHQMGHCALCPPRGTADLKWITVEYDRLARFERIILDGDDDEAGAEWNRRVAPRFAERAAVLRW